VAKQRRKGRRPDEKDAGVQFARILIASALCASHALRPPAVGSCLSRYWREASHTAKAHRFASRYPSGPSTLGAPVLPLASRGSGGGAPPITSRADVFVAPVPDQASPPRLPLNPCGGDAATIGPHDGPW
jgi:hypothetical protein